MEYQVFLVDCNMGEFVKNFEELRRKPEIFVAMKGDIDTESRTDEETVKQLDTYKRYKSLCVTKRNGKYFYPASIPRERGNSTIILGTAICIFLFIADVCTTDLHYGGLLFLYCGGYIVAFLLQVLYRFVLLKEEFLHILSRYQGSVLNIIKSVLGFPKIAVILLIISLFYSCGMSEIPNYKVNMNFIFFFIPTIYLLVKVLNLNSCILNDSLLISQINGLDYGAGLAYSFFYGYFNIVLPKKGDADKNLVELMEDYESTNKVKFQIKKLFILIPVSCHCFVSLQNKYSPSIDESSSLPEKHITVAGVQNRVYKNAVYKIINKNKKVYVSAEYATPLKTFKEVVENTGQHNEHYTRHKKEISLQFYLTLKMILEKTGFDQYCELIYFEDSYIDPKSEEHTKYYDVGKILLTRLKEIGKYQDKKND